MSSVDHFVASESVQKFISVAMRSVEDDGGYASHTPVAWWNNAGACWCTASCATTSTSTSTSSTSTASTSTSTGVAGCRN